MKFTKCQGGGGPTSTSPLLSPVLGSFWMDIRAHSTPSSSSSLSLPPSFQLISYSSLLGNPSISHSEPLQDLCGTGSPLLALWLVCLWCILLKSLCARWRIDWIRLTFERVYICVFFFLMALQKVGRRCGFMFSLDPL